jgi:hypothetical protein
MASLTGRYTSSPESALEFDLARFREVKDADQFVSTLERICELTMPEDFWAITLPNDLATSSPVSPSLYAYHASLVLLDAKALFSNQKVADFVDPISQGTKSGVERHHLFPRAYLPKVGITEQRDINQIANYALVEWGDNIKISDQAPAEYLLTFKTRFGRDELNQMYQWHALPGNWEQMQYREFLEARRVLIARVIQKAYQTLTAEKKGEIAQIPATIDQMVEIGESTYIEFKSTLRMNLHTGSKDPKMELSILRTIAGFLNTHGGTLMTGIADDGTVLGRGVDGFENEDKMSLHLVNLIKDRMGPIFLPFIHMRFEDYKDNRVMAIECMETKSPVYVKDGTVERFYIRTGPSTTELTASQIQEYLKQRFRT